jgi:hypothetical protein
MHEQYSELRARIAHLGLSQSGLARRMKQLDDDQDERNIPRSIQRMIAGDARISCEMRALIGLMEEHAASDTRGRPSARNTKAGEA